MSEISLTGSSGAFRASASDSFQSEKSDANPQPKEKKGLSDAQIARLFGLTEHQLKAYEESLAQAAAKASSPPPFEEEESLKQDEVAQPADEAESVIEPAFAPWSGGKPSSVQALVDFMASRGIGINANDAAHFLHGLVGVNEDMRNFDAILNAPNPFEANNQALGFMFRDRNFVHGSTHASSDVCGSLERAGQLVTDGNRLYAQTANEAQLVPMRLPKGGMQSGGLARYGIADEDAAALINNPAVSEKIKDMLGPYLGTGYKAEEGTKYVVQRPLEFDLSAFIGSDRSAR